MPAGFQNVDKADQVAVDVFIGLIDTIADAGLSGEIDNDVEIPFCEQVVQRGFVADVDRFEVKSGMFQQLLEPGLFQIRIIVIVEAVDPRYLVTLAAEVAGEMKAIKPAAPVISKFSLSFMNRG